MMKLILTILTCIFCVSGIAKENTIDSRGLCYMPDHPEAQSEFWVTFNATPASLENNSPGHAYITLEAPKDNYTKNCKFGGAFGQNPKGKSLKTLFSFDITLKEGFKFNVLKGGVVYENILNLEPAHTLKVRVTSEQYRVVSALTESWSDEDYILTKKDCINFIIDVAKSIDGIKVPERNLKQFPTDYLKSLIESNNKKFSTT
ncbi:MAG: hypothetical protein HAW67_03080 [Endozoicomonadaceae bacterium]|nr:hypothetical protein [Endozoicomonadaceae bacterium]